MLSVQNYIKRGKVCDWSWANKSDHHGNPRNNCLITSGRMPTRNNDGDASADKIAVVVSGAGDLSWVEASSCVDTSPNGSLGTESLRNYTFFPM